MATSKRKISIETFEDWNAPGKRAGYTYYCVKYKNKFAGIFFVQENKKELLIKAIAIKKEYRKLGLGKYAIQKAITMSKTRGLPLRTEVLLHNVDSINWFFKMGFFIIRYNEKTSDYLMEYRP